MYKRLHTLFALVLTVSYILSEIGWLTGVKVDELAGAKVVRCTYRRVSRWICEQNSRRGEGGLARAKAGRRNVWLATGRDSLRADRRRNWKQDGMQTKAWTVERAGYGWSAIIIDWQFERLQGGACPRVFFFLFGESTEVGQEDSVRKWVWVD